MDIAERTITQKVQKTSDVEIHVSLLETDMGQYVDIREYVVSLDQYGRGITFPAFYDDVTNLGLGLTEIATKFLS